MRKEKINIWLHSYKKTILAVRKNYSAGTKLALIVQRGARASATSRVAVES
jgi:ABC-type transport system involved in Fe-S cluster assembly fused permease/ATPase subunit